LLACTGIISSRPNDGVSHFPLNEVHIVNVVESSRLRSQAFQGSVSEGHVVGHTPRCVGQPATLQSTVAVVKLRTAAASPAVGSYSCGLGSRGGSHAGKINESPANDSSVEFLRQRAIDQTAANLLF